VFPVSEPHAYRIELQEGVVVRLRKLDGTARDAADDPRCLHIPYSDTFVISRSRMESGIAAIRAEAAARVRKLRSIGKPLAAQRLKARVEADTEMMEEEGHCPGMENYLQPLLGYPPGTPPDNLLTFFPSDVLVFFDESHLLIPQFDTQYKSDHGRKSPLVEHGYRLPSSLGYRPMRLDEFEERVSQVIHVSATPKRYELEKAGDAVVEMLRRPSGAWLDPAIEVVAKSNQLEHLVGEIRQRVAAGEAVFVNVRRKRAAENVAAYLQGHDIRAAWMHDKLKPKDRFRLFADLRERRLDVLVGVGLLREGIDLPRVSLVAILDADKPGLFRDEASLLQYVGRAARNPRGRAIFYADTATPAMAAVIAETRRRRHRQRQSGRT
jgi:excinuclease ABC subunit B